MITVIMESLNNLFILKLKYIQIFMHVRFFKYSLFDWVWDVILTCNSSFISFEVNIKFNPSFILFHHHRVIEEVKVFEVTMELMVLVERPETLDQPDLQEPPAQKDNPVQKGHPVLLEKPELSV